MPVAFSATKPQPIRKTPFETIVFSPCFSDSPHAFYTQCYIPPGVLICLVLPSEIWYTRIQNPKSRELWWVCHINFTYTVHLSNTRMCLYQSYPSKKSKFSWLGSKSPLSFKQEKCLAQNYSLRIQKVKTNTVRFIRFKMSLFMLWYYFCFKRSFLFHFYKKLLFHFQTIQCTKNFCKLDLLVILSI